MGFFLANVLDGFIPVARLKGDEAFASRCEEALAGQRRRSRSAGRAIITRSTSPTTAGARRCRNAMTTGWAAYSGAVR